MDLAPFGVGEAGTKLGNRGKPVIFRVVDAPKQRAYSKLRALALPEVVAEQDEVDRVIQFAAGVAFQLDPIEVARASLVFGFGSLDHHPFQALADVVQQRLGENLDRVGLDDWSWKQHGGSGDHLVDHREPLLIWQLREVPTVAVEEVEDEGDQRQVLRGLLDAVLTPAACCQLEWKVFLAVRDRLAVEDQRLILQPPSGRGQLGEHQGEVLEVA